MWFLGLTCLSSSPAAVFFLSATWTLTNSQVYCAFISNLHHHKAQCFWIFRCSRVLYPTFSELTVKRCLQNYPNYIDSLIILISLGIDWTQVRDSVSVLSLWKTQINALIEDKAKMLIKPFTPSSPSEYFTPHLGEYVNVLSALEKLNVAILKAMDKTKEVGGFTEFGMWKTYNDRLICSEPGA